MAVDNRFGAYMDPFLEAAPGREGELTGTTFAVKDVFAVAGHRSSAGNPDWLASHGPAACHAPAVARLLEAGATLKGATHTDELMYSLGGENIHYGTPVNPRAPGRIPGGSSSGSAVAVASGQADIGLGTDTGGSVRVPASYCGLYGFRPTHGAVDAAGVIPLAPTFDTVGWMTARPDLLLQAGRVLLAEAHAGAAQMQPRRPGFRRVLVDAEAWSLADPETAAALTPPLERLQAAAGTACETRVAAEGLGDWMQLFRELQGAEIWGVHGDWVKRASPRFAPDIAGRFRLAEGLAGGDRAAAWRRRGEIAQRLGERLGDDGCLVIPTVPDPAPLRGGRGARLEAERSRAMMLCCIAGLAGLPQVTLPAGSVAGLPVGLSVIAGRSGDLGLLQWIVSMYP